VEALRKAAVAGSWYPGDPALLRAEVEGHLESARPAPSEGALVALVSPHAGLRYSGPVAAHGYGLLRGRRGLTVVLVGPSHHVRFEGMSLWLRGGFETPLGVAAVDDGLASRLIEADDWIREDPGPHRPEHSLEMQLPFLQHVVEDLRIVPILMGSQSRDEVGRLARALTSVLAARPRVLLVASSDLSHYHPAHRARALDAQVIEDVERFDADALMDRLEGYRGHACGGGPMVAVMRAARELGATQSQVLRYADSGDAGERDKSRVVGYLSAAFLAAPR
jgi:AmmeMemoRadiSam system protein B